MTSNNEKKLLTKSDINRVFWRSFTVNASFNYERQMSQGAQYALSPILQKLYAHMRLTVLVIENACTELVDITSVMSQNLFNCIGVPSAGRANHRER